MAVNAINTTIGMANITVDGVEVPRQADAATFSAEPNFIEVDLYTAYKYDRRVDGWDVSVTIVADEESIEGYKMALSGVTETTEGGLEDGKGLESQRENGKEVIIHPIDMGEDKTLDIIIHKAIPSGAVERVYGKEVEGYEITLTGLNVSGDYSKSGNYFRIGEKATP